MAGVVHDVSAGPVYAAVVFGRGMIFPDWAALQRWRERFEISQAAVHSRKCPSVGEARAWLEGECGVQVVGSWHVEAGRDASRFDGDAGGGTGARSTECSVVTRLSYNPFEVGADESVVARVSAPGARISCIPDAAPSSLTVPVLQPESSVSPPIGSLSSEARGSSAPLQHDPRALETAELRLSKESRFPEFGFELVLPGNVLYAVAKNLVVRPALQQVGSVRGRQAAMLFEALNSDLGSIAVAVRVTSLDMSVCLKQRVAAWRERGGKDAKGKPVADFGVLDSLERLVRERRLAVRVSDAQHAARMARLQVVGATAGVGAAGVA